MWLIFGCNTCLISVSFFFVENTVKHCRRDKTIISGRQTEEVHRNQWDLTILLLFWNSSKGQGKMKNWRGWLVGRMLRKVRVPCTTVTAVIQSSCCGAPPQRDLGLLSLYFLVFYKYGQKKKNLKKFFLNSWIQNSEWILDWEQNISVSIQTKKKSFLFCSVTHQNPDWDRACKGHAALSNGISKKVRLSTAVNLTCLDNPLDAFLLICS